MKNILTKFSDGFKVTMILVAVSAVVLFSLDMQAQFTMPAEPSDAQYNVVPFKGFPNTMPSQSVSNNWTGGQPMTLQKDLPLSIWIFIAGSNNSVSNVIATFRLGYGSTNVTNYATSPVLTCTNLLTGTNQQANLFQFNSNQLSGARSIIFWQLSNTNTNQATIGKVLGSQFIR